MTDQGRLVLAINRWLLDLALIAVGFFFAYHVRLLFALEGHSLLPFGVYGRSLAIMVVVWAVALPLFGVYREPSQGWANEVRRLTKAAACGGVFTAATQFLANRTQLFSNPSNRIMMIFATIIAYVLLVGYRFLLLRRNRHAADRIARS